LRVEKDATTKGGVYMGFLEDVTWGDDNETHPADIAQICGRVVKCPPKLYYNEDDPHNSMPWDTDMQLEIGDICFFNLIESLNANEVEVDGKIIRLIPYSDIYVAKKDIWIERDYYWNNDNELKTKYTDKTKIICLNGYVLLELVPIPKISELDQIHHGVYQDRGIVRYLGEPNRAYVNRKDSDDINIKEGELAYFRPGWTPFLLERRQYFAVFEGDKLFWLAQRRRIILSV